MSDYFDDSFNPFDRFLQSSDRDMLNSALPYVSKEARKPLALYIKMLEIKRILTDFDREEVLSACGFEQNSADPEAMLRAMKMASGNSAPQIDSILNMINLIRTYQTFMEFMQNNPEMASFLTNMMNQQGQANPMDMLKQFSPGKETDNTMNQLFELLKNTNFSR